MRSSKARPCTSPRHSDFQGLCHQPGVSFPHVQLLKVSSHFRAHSLLLCESSLVTPMAHPAKTQHWQPSRYQGGSDLIQGNRMCVTITRAIISALQKPPWVTETTPLTLVCLGPRLSAWHFLREQYPLVELNRTQLNSTVWSSVSSQGKGRV